MGQAQSQSMGAGDCSDCYESGEQGNKKGLFKFECLQSKMKYFKDLVNGRALLNDLKPDQVASEVTPAISEQQMVILVLAV